MLERSEDKIINEENIKDNYNFEAKQNLLGFFNKLLEIDKRLNPHLYKKEKNNENHRDRNNTD
jgi:hypothetical protein